MSQRTRVGVVQMTSQADVAVNLDTAERLVRRAAEDGAQLVVLPECFAYLGPDEGFRDVAEPLPGNGPVLTRCSRMARECGAELVVGGFWERVGDERRVRNACVHFGADGALVSIYRKIHLFDVDLPGGPRLVESDNVQPGTDVVVTQTRFGALGLSVCYDLRFPELYRRLVDGGAIALAVPAAFTLTTGKDHWHVLLRARAIESQAYVLAAAQTGWHFGKRVSYGHALIVDPWGVVLAECGEGEGAAVAWVEPDVVERVRNTVPSLRHRRLT